MTFHQVLPFSPFLDIYCMPRRHLDNWQPRGAALYAFHADDRVYLGESADLASRLMDSLREQGFGDTIICIILNPHRFPSRDARLELEKLCISALHTLLWGHGTPLSLTNKRDVVLLEDVAWNADRPEGISIAICIARTILHAFGMPSAWFDLPCRWALYTISPVLLARHNRKIKPLFLKRAASLRQGIFDQALALSGSPRHCLKAQFAQFYAEE